MKKAFLGVVGTSAAIPTAIIVVFVVALLNGLAWSWLTPPFQVPDETAHFAYAQSIAERGVPAGTAGRPEASSEQAEAMVALNTLAIIGRPLVHPPPTSAAVHVGLARASEFASRSNGGGPSSASGQPPLYYSLAAATYRLFTWAPLTTRLHVMRALSATFFAVACALCALSARTLLPRFEGAALLGGLSIALSPYTAFIASGVTPDTLLLALSAALVFLLANAFRDGMSRRSAIGLGAVLGAGAATKLTFLAFVPPSLVMLVFLFIRDRDALKDGRRVAAFVGALALSTLTLPVLGVVWAMSSHGAHGATEATSAVIASHGSSNFRLIAVYGWELFFPRLPFMSHQFSYSPPVVTWVDGFAGRYGWLDYAASDRVRQIYEWAMIAVGTGALVTFLRSWRQAAKRWVEALGYLGLFAALAAVIAKTGFDYRSRTNYVFEQPRYLFGLAPFYATAVAAACRSLGLRAATLVGPLLVTALSLHNLAGITETLFRYYA